jgi:ABC-type multidrug transport system ATPase subunit
VSALTKAFGRVAVLRSLDLDVPWGQVLAVLGPNGSGKTTLLKALATLTSPDAGSIHVAGLDLARHGAHVRRLIGVVTHETMLYGDLTGAENLSVHARLFGIEDEGPVIDSVAERLGISDLLETRTGTLSHGMRRRFSIARSLLHDPPILLLDEPESGLDQEALALFRRVVEGFSEERRTVLITTHNLERGLSLADRAVVLSRGRIAFDATLNTIDVEDVREAYAHHTGTEP